MGLLACITQKYIPCKSAENLIPDTVYMEAQTRRFNELTN